MTPSKDARQHMLDATVALLLNGADPAHMTVRQIAGAADVATGAINYHFQSKDHLVSEAIGQIMQAEAAKWLGQIDDAGDDPAERLRQLLKTTSRIGAIYPDMMRVMVSHVLAQGDFGVPLMIVPLLRKIFGDAYDELALRLMALQIVLPLQVMAMNPESALMFTGIDLFDDAQRDQGIDQLIDHLLNAKGDTQ